MKNGLMSGVFLNFKRMVNYFPPEPLLLPFYPFLLKKKKKKKKNFLITNKVCNRSVSGNSNFCCFLTELKSFIYNKNLDEGLPWWSTADKRYVDSIPAREPGFHMLCGMAKRFSFKGKKKETL